MIGQSLLQISKFRSSAIYCKQNKPITLKNDDITAKCFFPIGRIWHLVGLHGILSLVNTDGRNAAVDLRLDNSPDPSLSFSVHLPHPPQKWNSEGSGNQTSPGNSCPVWLFMTRSVSTRLNNVMSLHTGCLGLPSGLPCEDAWWTRRIVWECWLWERSDLLWDYLWWGGAVLIFCTAKLTYRS